MRPTRPDEARAQPLPEAGCWSPGPRRTLARSFTLAGVGLHTGVSASLTARPAPSGTGRRFVRVDLPGRPSLGATLGALSSTERATSLAEGGAEARTVEHLLAALVALGVDDVFLELTGPEVPSLDGSSRPWAEAVLASGLAALDAPRRCPRLPRTVAVYRGDAFAVALPASALRFSAGVSFEDTVIGTRWSAWSPSSEPFSRAIAPARTFALAGEVDALRAAGLALGGTLEGALVCGPEGWVNPPLRFEDEPSRHKLLDLVGDLALLGAPPRAHYVTFRAGHSLHAELARELAVALGARADEVTF